MEMKNKFMLVKEIEGKEFVFMCDQDAPAGCAFDAVNHFRAHIVEKINEAVKDKDVQSEPVQVEG